jgi:uridylate kinase
VAINDDHETPGQKSYRRLLLKLSGEALMGSAGYGIDPDVATDLRVRSLM